MLYFYIYIIQIYKILGATGLYLCDPDANN